MQKNIRHSKHSNRATYLITCILGILLALTGFEHGLFAFMQGNKSTNGMFFQAIGKTQQRWKYGGEDAFTLIPNFQTSGLLAMALSILIIFWILHNPREHFNATIFLFMFIFLTLTGGGIGYIPFFVITWVYSIRINKLPKFNLPHWFAKLWPYTLTLTGACWLLAVEVAVLGYFPGITDPEKLLSLTWLLLFIALISLNLSYISGYANDIKK